MKRLLTIITALVIILASCKNDNGPWESLIKNDLGNWQHINGPAHYELKDGVIIGTAVPGYPSDDSFLCTKNNYGDFILEFDTWFDSRMNSGVQIRSESHADYLDGQVFGYQVELDASPRAWTGGIYDESRRLWLYTLDINPPAKKAFKDKEWNHFRIEAIGNSIRTWVNGIPCADLVDDATPSGFIALQVHGIGKDSTLDGIQAKWKNIRIITKDPAKYATPYSPDIPQVSYLNNSLSEREKSEGWKLLFDGKTSSGWMNAKTKTFPSSGWEIKDGVLTINSESNSPGNGGDIVSIDKFKNFELIVDFLYTPGANSGIKYFVDTESSDGKLSSIGCEYQILDDRRHPDAKEGINGNRRLAGLYDLIPPENSRDNGPGKWNRAMIIVNGNKIQHWLNGQMTLEYERSNQKWRDLVATSKFKNSPGFGEVKEGRILLQDHGNTVSFKNIKIKEL
jgi:hypothetical protein